MRMTLFAEQTAMLEQATAPELRGTVAQVRGLALRVIDLPVPIGAMVKIVSRRSRGADAPGILGEVVGFDDEQTLVMPLGATTGIQRGDRVIARHAAQFVRVGESLLGRVLDGLGRPIDGKGPLGETFRRPLNPRPVEPLDRPRIDQPLATGVRAIDAMASVGRGQRLGIFAAPGVGKSTLLATMARHTAADISVVGLVGERGREVRDFIETALGEEGLARSVVVCATSDEPAIVRLRAASVATAAAEYFRDQGADVLLMMDSVTRFCQAQRQVGLAAGEPPATRGYPPSVFATLPTLLERSGRTRRGSITGFYTVLVEGDDMDEPVADACRGILDGHIVLSRKLAEKGHYPAVDVLRSISRVAEEVTAPEHRAVCREVVRLLASYDEVEELLNIGAYAPGSNPEFDLAIECKPAIDQLLQQGRGEVKGRGDFERTKAQLIALGQQVQQVRQKLQATGRGGPARR
ncbi:MAG: FliI/YscN family ATPase [Phycisphaeraceae bacterium]